MINVFKQLPLRAKLILIGLIPLLLLVGLSMEFYWLEWKKYNQSIDDLQAVSRSSMVNRLMDQLQEERRFAYEYALKTEGYAGLLAQQDTTDHVISQMEKDPDLKGFEKYTMLDSLQAVRKKSDSHKLSVGQVMNYYTISIFRISMIEVIPQLQISNSGQLNRELRSARAMSQIITYMGILRSNIYNVLYSRQFKFGNGTLQGLLGPYDIFLTYQTEFKAEAPLRFLYGYDTIVHGKGKPAMDYMAKSFKTMRFDSTTYTDEQWWKLSGSATDAFRKLQAQIWGTINQQLTSIKNHIHRNQGLLLLSLFLALAASIILIALTVSSITSSLTELRVAAEKIAVGETGITLNIPSEDVVGKLAHAVLFIDSNNQTLADAADEIRKGNFNVAVKPRGTSDVLGNSLLQMKNELQRNTEEKAEQAAELERLLTAVTASETYFRKIADQTPFMIWQFNNRGKAIYVNKQWTDFTGLTFGESLGSGWSRALHPEGMKEAQLVKNFAGMHSFRTRARFKNKDNEYRWVLVQADPIYNNEVFEGFIGSLTDITDQIAAQDALVELMNKKDEFLSIASHELKTPLTSIKAYTQLLKRDIKPDDKLYPMASKTLHHVDRLEKLVNDLLDVSRINSSQMAYKDEVFAFKDMLMQTVENFTVVFGGHKVIVENAMPALIKGDRLRIEQVISNLLNNAAKYSPGKDRIIVNSFIDDGSLVVSIQDFGIGIEKKDQELLFQKFYRTQKDFYKFQGLGLGLFISGEIVNRHNGKLWVESEPGKGSTFFIKLPLA